MIKTVLFCFILITIPSAALTQSQDSIKEQFFREIEQKPDQAAKEDIPFYAPVNFDQAREFFESAMDKYQRGDKLKDIQSDLDNAAHYLRAARESSKLSRIALEELALVRRQALEIQPDRHAPEIFQQAESAFNKVLRDAEAGNIRSVREKIPEVEKMYRSTVIAAFEKSIIKTAENDLVNRQTAVANGDFQKSILRLDQLKTELTVKRDESFDIPTFVNDISDKIRGALEPIYREFYRHLPDTLKMGSFTLYILSYSSKGTYNFQQDHVEELSGQAELAFQCGDGIMTVVPLGSA